MQQSYVINQAQLQQVVDYLIGRPYGEVQQLIRVLTSLERVTVEPPTKAKKPKQ